MTYLRAEVTGAVGGHLRMLQRLVGPQTAAAMVLAGRRLDAAAARNAGLVLDVVADDRLLTAADDLAERIGQTLFQVRPLITELLPGSGTAVVLTWRPVYCFL